MEELKKCKNCGNNLNNPNYPEDELCKECYLKWREEALKCRICKNIIEWHNYYWHDKLCDECFFK